MTEQHATGGRITPVFETDFVAITLDLPHSLLLLEWKRLISLSERKQGFGKALELTSDHQLKHWLVNDLQLPIISTEEKEWILSEFQEAASRTSIKKLAVVTPDFLPSLIGNTEFTAKGQEGYKAKGTIWHEVFPDQVSALSWLLSEDEWEL